METMVTIYLYGKKYEVPSSLTIMNAMEYAGYQLVRGVGCRCGFCGACATIYRIKGERELKTCLACQTKVEDNMYIATLPFFPLVKQPYDIEKVKPTEQIMMQLYPEIYSKVALFLFFGTRTKVLRRLASIVVSRADSPLLILLVLLGRVELARRRQA